MGDVKMLVLIMIVVLIVGCLVLGWINYKISKLKDEIDGVYVGKENAAAAVGVLEGLIRNLNAMCRDHQKRLDILEANHPDDEIDYGTVDDNGNITEVWFNGKKYVPEDKRNEDTVAFYADGRVVAETTRPEEKHCCATCRHYRPGPDHTCTIRPWLQVTKQYATNAHSACNNYKKAYTPTKGQVDYPYIKLNRIAGDAEVDELRKRIEKLNYICNTGLISVAEWERRWEELMQNDS